MLGRMDRHAPSKRQGRPAPGGERGAGRPDLQEPGSDRPSREGHAGEPGADRAASYREAVARIGLLLEGETDWVAAMATVACELHGAFHHFDWTGFYRVVGDELVVGPYQGTHGCLRIAYGRGVCGTAWKEARTQLVPDVREFAGHIACSDSTLSEIVVPVLRPDGSVLAILDVDSDRLAAFDDVDVFALEALCAELGERFGAESR
ncbi:MAG: GAF domain-containing protein [bacterium]